MSSPYDHGYDDHADYEYEIARIDVCRRIVADHRAEEIDGVLIDAQTANLLVKIWELLGSKSRETFETMDIGQLGRWAWRQVK